MKKLAEEFDEIKVHHWYSIEQDAMIVNGTFQGYSAGQITVKHPNFFEKLIGISFQDKVTIAKQNILDRLHKKQKLYHQSKGIL